MATVVTDFTALYLLPDKAAYAGYKYTDTPDFSDLRDAREAEEGRGALENPLLGDGDGVDERKSGDPDGPGLRMCAPEERPEPDARPASDAPGSGRRQSWFG